MRSIIGPVTIAVLVVMIFQALFGIAYVHGDSMEPTFQEGNVLLLKKWGTPGKGTIVTAYIQELDCAVVKRILAVEGDNITVYQDRIYLNGQEAAEVVIGEQKEQEIFLLPDQYFLIGDNQGVSLDSRTFGCVGKADICGTVICKLF